MNCYLKKDGEIVAETQHELPHDLIEEINAIDADRKNKFDIVEDDYFVYVCGERFKYTFSKHYGCFTSIIVDGLEHLSEPMRISAFRAPTDNDRNVIRFWANQNVWEGENLDCAFTKIYKCALKANTLLIEASLAGVSRSPLFRYTQMIIFYATGKVGVEVIGNVRTDAHWLPRIGFEFAMPGEMQRFSYYGMGPQENYCDMCHHAKMGYYESNVADEYVPYVVPQEHGNHTKVRKLWIGNLVFAGKNCFECNVSKYSAMNLYHAMHTDELIRDGKTHVRIDYKVSGIGSNSCGPQLQKQYRVDEKEIDFAFEFEINK